MQGEIAAIERAIEARVSECVERWYREAARVARRFRLFYREPGEGEIAGELRLAPEIPEGFCHSEPRIAFHPRVAPHGVGATCAAMRGYVGDRARRLPILAPPEGCTTGDAAKRSLRALLKAQRIPYRCLTARRVSTPTPGGSVTVRVHGGRPFYAGAMHAYARQRGFRVEIRP